MEMTDTTDAALDAPHVNLPEIDALVLRLAGENLALRAELDKARAESECEPDYVLYTRTNTIPDPLDDPRVVTLVGALKGLLTHYVDMANSGDAGFWDCEEEPVVIAARAALTLAKGEKP